MVNLIKTIDFDSNDSGMKIEKLVPGVYEVKKGGEKFIIEVLSVDTATKSISIRHQHSVHDLVFKNDLDLILDKMGIKRTVETLKKNITAPMPGKVIDVMAAEGKSVAKGEGILILEAMKMENVLKAEADCLIKKIIVQKGESVEKNQLLVELDHA